jgi:hypothetical protein
MVAVAPRGWRYLSSPWVVMIFVFGFLPWSEVSCNSKEVEIRLTQSGYQALYGGVSAPPAVEAVLAKQSERMSSTQARQETAQRLQMQLQVEQSYLASVSPFLVFFWGAALALLCIFCSAPLGGWRLGFALPLCGLMLAVLIIHACIGLPLERRIGQVAAEAMREDASKGMLLLAFTSGKTIWFWLTLASVGLLAATEPLLNWVRAERSGGWLVPGGITGATITLILVGVLSQFALREMIVSAMEDRIDELQQAEEEKRQNAEAELRQREAERLAEARKREAEAEHSRQQVALAEQRRQQEREEQERRDRLEQQRSQDEARQRAEREAKEAAEREEARRAELHRKAKEEVAREAARKAELEGKDLPYYPRPLTRYEERNAEEWYQLLLDRPQNARVHAQVTKALPALKEEGAPFLLDWLGRQSTPKDRNTVLRLIRVEHIHRNDLHKLLPCLDQKKNSSATRLLALEYLEKRAKDLKRKLAMEIELLADDLLTDSRLKEDTRAEIRNRIETIRKEAK